MAKTSTKKSTKTKASTKKSTKKVKYNNTSTNKRSAYQAEISCRFINGSETIDIPQIQIRFIVIEDMYESRVMPAVYLSIYVDNDLYTKIQSNERTAKFWLKIDRVNAFSKLSNAKRSINSEFTYITSSSNPNYTEVLNENETDEFNRITLALFSMDLMNNARTGFYGNFGEIDTATIIGKALEGLDSNGKEVVVKAPIYNTLFEKQVIPVLNSRKKLLKYIFNQSPFYDTDFIFYMDFDRSYLVDLNGEGCQVNDGELHDVIFDIREVTSDQSYIEGITVQNGANYIYVNASDTSLKINKSQDNIANQLVVVPEEGITEENRDNFIVDIDINSREGSSIKQAFKRASNAKLYKNLMESNIAIMEIERSHINGTVFTPNKKYMIKNYKDGTYDGTYTLLYKLELIVNNAGVFNSSCRFGLRKVENIIPIDNTQPATSSAKNSKSKNTTTNVNPDNTVTDTKNVPRNTSKTTTVSAKKKYSDIDRRFAGPQKIIKSHGVNDDLKI